MREVTFPLTAILSTAEVLELRHKYPTRKDEGWGVTDEGIASWNGDVSVQAAQARALHLHPELLTWFAVRRLCSN